MSKHYGWIPDRPDQRDLVYKPTAVAPATLPNSVDLRPYMPMVYDQGQLGSCTANSSSGAFDYVRGQEKLGFMTPSRLFLYYNTRLSEGTEASDAGASIRDTIKSLNATGVCPESEWPYDVSKFADAPTVSCYSDAKKDTLLTYQRIKGGASIVTNMMTALAAGQPVVFGFTVYESFESDAVAASGIVPMPKKKEQVLGGHAVVAVGYDQTKKAMLVRNSWGSNWGIGGYFWMPFTYFTKSGLVSDVWTLSKVS